MLHERPGVERERGQILVLFALTITVILMFAAIAVDLGVLRNNRQILHNTTDAAALAGGTLMPVDGSVSGAAAAVATLTNSTILRNYPGLRQSATAIGSRCVVGVDSSIANCDYTISYRCLVGVDPTTGNAWISRDVPATCDPRPSLGASNLVSKFTGAGPSRTSSCNPAARDKCNVIVVQASSTTQYAFGATELIGITSGSSGAVASASCGGPCGAQWLFNDVELVIDTSGSMNSNYSGSPLSPRIYWAKQAAIQLVADLQHNGGFTALDPAVGNRVGITTFSGTSATVDATAWTSDDVQLTAKINAITAGGITPLKVGMRTGAADLIAHARNAVGAPIVGAKQRVIILISDGRPNPDQGPDGQPANNTNAQRPTASEIATYLASADVAYSVAIGQGGSGSSQVDLNLMKLIATPDNLAASPPQVYSYNVVDASGLPSVFTQIAGQIIGAGAHLIQLYPTPVVTNVSPNAGTQIGGTPIVIRGQYFTGAISVTVGGAQATAVTVTNDTTITAVTPPGSVGQVDVIVTTPGGTSTSTALDRFTFN